MSTTLNQIRSQEPCSGGWAKLLKHLGKTKADDEPLSLLTVLESNGLDDAIWCLRTEATPERIHRFTLAVARRVEYLHPLAKACNDVTERFLNGTATKAELDDAASHAAYAAARAATYVARAAARAASHASHANVYAAHAARAAAYALIVDSTTEREAQAQIFREIFA